MPLSKRVYVLKLSYTYIIGSSPRGFSESNYITQLKPYENEFRMPFHFHANPRHFHKISFTLRLALKERHIELGNGLFTGDSRARRVYRRSWVRFRSETRIFSFVSGSCHVYQFTFQIYVSFSCVCPVIDREFPNNIVKRAVDPRVDPQTMS